MLVLSRAPTRILQRPRQVIEKIKLNSDRNIFIKQYFPWRENNRYKPYMGILVNFIPETKHRLKGAYEKHFHCGATRSIFNLAARLSILSLLRPLKICWRNDCTCACAC